MKMSYCIIYIYVLHKVKVHVGVERVTVKW